MFLISRNARMVIKLNWKFSKYDTRLKLNSLGEDIWKSWRWHFFHIENTHPNVNVCHKNMFLWFSLEVFCCVCIYFDGALSFLLSVQLNSTVILVEFLHEWKVETKKRKTLRKVVIPCSVIVFLAVYKVRVREAKRRCNVTVVQNARLWNAERPNHQEQDRTSTEGMTWLSQWQHANTFIKWKIWKCKVSSTFSRVDIHF